MAISVNTGTTAHAETAASCNVTIPAGVLAGDVMVMMLTVFTETGSTPAISFSGGGGTWTLVPMTTGTNPEVATAGSSVWSYGFAYTRVATAGDPGATVTVTETGSAAGTTWFAIALEAYTGCNTAAPVDVAFGANAQGTAQGTAPSGNTATAGDWAIHMDGGGINTGPLVGPAGSTQRQNIDSSASVCAGINDSNGPVGGAGTSIGGGHWSQTGSTANWWSMFTIGLAAAPAAVTLGFDDGDTPWHIRSRKGR